MRRWVMGVLAAIAALGLVAGGAALAAQQKEVLAETIEQRPLLSPLWPGRPGGDWPRDGRLQEYCRSAVAEELGMTLEEFEARLAEGETLLSIARDQGLDDEALRDLSQRARDKALEAAVADGVISEDQAEWLRQRGFGLALGVPGLGGGRWFGRRPCWGDGAPGFAPWGGRSRPWGR